MSRIGKQIFKIWNKYVQEIDKQMRTTEMHQNRD